MTTSTKADWAVFLQDIATSHPDAQRITLVMDNLNTHTPASLYEAFAPEQAKAPWDRFEFVYTPKHGSWLNMAEIEINVMVDQCLNRRIDNIETVQARWPPGRAAAITFRPKSTGNSRPRMPASSSNVFTRQLVHDAGRVIN